MERRSGRWRAAWWICLVATALNGVVVGYGAVWLQFFGDRPSREDYLVSAGGYLAAAAVIAVALSAAPSLQVGRTSMVAVGVVAGLLLLAGMNSVSNAVSLPTESLTVSGPLDGVGGVVLLPWSWVLIYLSVRRIWS